MVPRNSRVQPFGRLGSRDSGRVRMSLNNRQSFDKSKLVQAARQLADSTTDRRDDTSALKLTTAHITFPRRTLPQGAPKAEATVRIKNAVVDRLHGNA